MTRRGLEPDPSSGRSSSEFSDSPTGAGGPATSGDSSDEALVQRAQKGDTHAFDQLVRRHFDRIYGLLYHMMAHRQDAEDLAQTVFIRAYRSLRRFRNESSFGTWLYRIAVNAAITALGRRGRRVGEVSFDDLDAEVEKDKAYVQLVSGHTPRLELDRKELQARLNEALQALSDTHRAVVVMHDIQGLPHEEIARVLGVPVGTVRSRLFYARKQLQSALGEFLE